MHSKQAAAPDPCMICMCAEATNISPLTGVHMLATTVLAIAAGATRTAPTTIQAHPNSNAKPVQCASSAGICKASGLSAIVSLTQCTPNTRPSLTASSKRSPRRLAGSPVQLLTSDGRELLRPYHHQPSSAACIRVGPPDNEQQPPNSA
jgi:hypothetical protein